MPSKKKALWTSVSPGLIIGILWYCTISIKRDSLEAGLFGSIMPWQLGETCKELINSLISRHPQLKNNINKNPVQD